MPELTEEQLSQMSPEQMAELQKQNCLFCSLASGKLPSKIIYDDDLCFAIIDINPAAKGHVLLMPKDHYMIMPQAHEEVIRRLGKVSKLISKAMIKSFGATGTNIFIANGAVAGQRAPHLIVHIIPRNDDDGMTVFELPEKEAREEDLANIQRLLAQKLGTRIELPKEISERKDKSEKENKGKGKSEELEKIDLKQVENIIK
ncbi:TPA: HIT family protein [Candidatus Woesearchaeota archaeon]|nr:HIT family protein [Candidatus Woesearchaeota archaeon]HIH39734.1 HIT family protein [Candidatus Woesearchaeota archaeon]